MGTSKTNPVAPSFCKEITKDRGNSKDHLLVLSIPQMPQDGWLTNQWPWTSTKPGHLTGEKIEEDLQEDTPCKYSHNEEETNALIILVPPTTPASIVDSKDTSHIIALNTALGPTSSISMRTSTEHTSRKV